MLSKDFIVLPSAYLAPISYYYFLSKNRAAIIDIHENFVKRSIEIEHIYWDQMVIFVNCSEKKTMFRSMKQNRDFYN